MQRGLVLYHTVSKGQARWVSGRIPPQPCRQEASESTCKIGGTAATSIVRKLRIEGNKAQIVDETAPVT